MKPTSTPMSLLAHDLGVRSSGSPGRDLIQRLENYCLDLLGTTSPLEFALLLQSSEVQTRQVLEELLEWTVVDDDFLLIALVALAQELELTASRLCRGYPSDDTISEVLTQATVAMRRSQELAEGERVEFVLGHAFSRTRSEQRRLARHNVPTIRIPYDCDVEEPEVELEGATLTLLFTAVETRVISAADLELINKSRGVGKSLRNLADESGDSYLMLRKRRSRAEFKLRQHMRAKGVIQ
jgi:hypothetical protein